jgi:hypothetical protein
MAAASQLSITLVPALMIAPKSAFSTRLYS